MRVRLRHADVLLRRRAGHGVGRPLPTAIGEVFGAALASAGVALLFGGPRACFGGRLRLRREASRRKAAGGSRGARAAGRPAWPWRRRAAACRPPRAARTDADGASEPDGIARARARERAGGPRMSRAGWERGRCGPNWAATVVAGRAGVGGIEKILRYLIRLSSGEDSKFSCQRCRI